MSNKGILKKIFNFSCLSDLCILLLVLIKPKNLKKITILILLFFSIKSANAQWNLRGLTINHVYNFNSYINPRAINFSDTANGFIAADNVILKYNGTQWLPVSRNDITGNFDAVFTLNPRNTFFAGDYGVLYKYDGNSFTKINSGTSATLYSIYMIDSANGWVAGSSGTLLHIVGNKVEDNSLPVLFDFNRVYFDKPDHGWAFGIEQLSSSDSTFWIGDVYEYKNNKWSKHSELNGFLTDINFTPSGQGYISGSDNLFHFNQSLDLWQPVFAQTLSHPIYSISMLNDSLGVCAQRYNSYLLFKDGKWTTYNSTVENMFGVQYVDSAKIWAISFNNSSGDPEKTRNTFIYQLKDTGWKPISLNYLDTVRTEQLKAQLADVAAFGKKHLRLDGILINIPEDSDWTDSIPLIDQSIPQFLSAKLFNETDAWGQIGSGLIHVNGNAGVYHPFFNFSPFDSSGWINDIHFFEDTSAWGAGIKYTLNPPIVDIPFIAYYENGKDSITREFDPPTTKEPLKIHFANKNFGWCVGDSGLIVRYANNSWQMLDYPTDNKLNTVFTIDSVTAWAGGDNGILLKYDGKSWAKVNINTTKNINAIYFADKDHGWLAGEGGMLYKYDSTSWSKDTSITTNDLYDIFMVNSKYGWVVGDSGTILQYINNDTTVVGRIANTDIPSTIFPNPSSENVTIKFELEKAGNTVISLFNQQGNKVVTYNLGMLQPGKSSKEINISTLQDGTYFYEIYSSGERSVGKFIKVH